MRNQLALIGDERDNARTPSWKLDERTRRIGLKQVALARQQLLDPQPPKRRAHRRLAGSLAGPKA